MINKIISSLNSINSFSKKIIIVGCSFVFILCALGVAVIGYNSTVANEVDLYTLGSYMVYTSCVLLAQVVIAGLIIDFFNTVIHNNN